MKQRLQEAGDLLEITANAVMGLFVVGALALVSAWCYFMWRTSGETLNSGEKLGQLGDFIGGSINPLLSLLTLYALGMTVLLQARQLRLSREELKATRAELERTALAQEDGNRLMAEQLTAARDAARAQQAAADAQIESARALTAQAEHARVAPSFQCLRRRQQISVQRRSSLKADTSNLQTKVPPPVLSVMSRRASLHCAICRLVTKFRSLAI